MQKNAKAFNISHFAINAKDTDRALAFYKSVFGWKFEAWGPPGFFLIDTGDGIHGALQGVQQDPVPTKIGGYECTVTVEDVDATLEEIVNHGGSVQFPKSHIPGVGDIARVFDSEGNIFCIAKYTD